MRFSSRQQAVRDLPGVTGTARLDRRTGALVRRLRPGDIAVVDQLDLDHTTAQSLLDTGVSAVVNASASISGRYPTLGPELLARAGVLLVDQVGPEVFSRMRDGDTLRIHDGTLLVRDQPVADGRVLGRDDVATLMDEARNGLSAQMSSFTHNTAEFLRREQELLLHGQGVPRPRTPMTGRPVVVVVRGFDYLEDLKRLRPFIREQHPVLVGVDAGAEALATAGHRPDVVVVGEEGLAAGRTVGDRGGTVSDKTLRSAREVVLHTDRSGRAAGSDRLDRLGVDHQLLAASGTTEDVALLLADVNDASVIVTVGTHATLDEFLDRQRAGLASTFLTRLRVGPKLVDARGVPQLYAGRVRLWHLLLVLLAGLVALAVAVSMTTSGQQWWSSLWSSLGPDVRHTSSDVVDWIQGLFS